MKKVFLLISFAFLIVFLVGCGRKHQLICISSQQNSESKVEAYFNNKEDKLVKMKMTVTHNFDNNNLAKKYKKTVCENSEYDSCIVTIDGNKVTISYTLDEVENDEQSTLIDAKKEMEEAGFVCSK